KQRFCPEESRSARDASWRRSFAGCHAHYFYSSIVSPSWHSTMWPTKRGADKCLRSFPLIVSSSQRTTRHRAESGYGICIIFQPSLEVLVDIYTFVRGRFG
ncbi:unnamed protein product, partial [Ectocarpus sp. 12 AP-2014]